MDPCPTGTKGHNRRGRGDHLRSSPSVAVDKGAGGLLSGQAFGRDGREQGKGVIGEVGEGPRPQTFWCALLQHPYTCS